MSTNGAEFGPVTCSADIVPDPAPADPNGLAGLASAGRADLLAACLQESLRRVAALAATALSSPNASVMLDVARQFPGMHGALGTDGQQGTLEQLLCADVMGSAAKLIIGDTRLDRRAGNTIVPSPTNMLAWAGGAAS